MQVQDFQENDQLNQQLLLIKTAEVRLTKTQKQYLKMTLTDKTGELPCNLWNIADNDIAVFAAGTIVAVTGKITSYNDKLQVEVQQMAVANNQNLADFLPTAPEDYEKLKDELIEYVKSIQNPVYALIIKSLLHQHDGAFLSWPAAKAVHHNFYHGLLFHTISILRQLDHFAKQYQEQYPQLDIDLLHAGAIAHDMGKTIELSGPINTEYTTPGQLIGHISLIDGEINRIAERNNIPEDNQSLLLLRHMVLSHHGLQAYGSPVEPQILEAVLLHQADVTDANINTVSNQLKQTDANQWTSKIWSQNNHKFFNHQPDSEVEQ